MIEALAVARVRPVIVADDVKAPTSPLPSVVIIVSAVVELLPGDWGKSTVSSAVTASGAAILIVFWSEVFWPSAKVSFAASPPLSPSDPACVITVAVSCCFGLNILVKALPPIASAAFPAVRSVPI